jgi:hypothetical protein
MYINPTNCQSKEDWLAQYGEPTTERNAITNYNANKEDGKIPVCLLDNVVFSAAGVGFSLNETEAFAYPDGRKKTWFLVNISDLVKESSGCSNLKHKLA